MSKMNPLRKNVNIIQKYLLRAIGAMLKAFADVWGMKREDFYFALAEELKISPEQVEHYSRDGLPLPDRKKHEFTITQEELHNAIQNIFNSIVKKRISNDEKTTSAYLQINECFFDLINEYYSCVKKFEDSMPFLTADFENYLVSHLVFREAWPADEKPFTQEDRKLLKESLEKYPIKKISREQQTTVSNEKIYEMLSDIEYINQIANLIEEAKNKVPHS